MRSGQQGAVLDQSPVCGNTASVGYAIRVRAPLRLAWADRCDRAHDTLAARLIDDLGGLADREGIRPDLVVLSGDLAEQARPSEFGQVRESVTAVASALGLKPDRVAMVPGNHDVNWHKCQACLTECQADEREPEAPYWPKWKPFADMLDAFYGVETRRTAGPMPGPDLVGWGPILRTEMSGISEHKIVPQPTMCEPERRHVRATVAPARRQLARTGPLAHERPPVGVGHDSTHDRTSRTPSTCRSRRR
jgi:3',5'-cyclic AMP phosphodiesterase CpdA